jgi:hypothetical protein
MAFVLPGWCSYCLILKTYHLFMNYLSGLMLCTFCESLVQRCYRENLLSECENLEVSAMDQTYV